MRRGGQDERRAEIARGAQKQGRAQPEINRATNSKSGTEDAGRGVHGPGPADGGRLPGFEHGQAAGERHAHQEAGRHNHQDGRQEAHEGRRGGERRVGRRDQQGEHNYGQGHA